MIWNKHSDLEGKHSLLSPSNPTWLNYNDDLLKEKLTKRYLSFYRKDMGTAIHEFAAASIELRQRLNADKRALIKSLRLFLYGTGKYDKALIAQITALPEEVFVTLIDYVNDAIGYKMDPEVLLYYSPFCFGTADAITFKNNNLIIHDLKTGSLPVHVEQLYVYAALYCLEYRVKPIDISTTLRIYQMANIIEMNPTPDEIERVINKIISSDKTLIEIREEY